MYIIKTIKLAFVDDVNYKLLPSLQFIRLRTHMFTVRKYIVREFCQNRIIVKRALSRTTSPTESKSYTSKFDKTRCFDFFLIRVVFIHLYRMSFVYICTYMPLA